MASRRNRFSTEVNFGLLAIIFVLLLLNVAANFIIFKTRNAQRETVADRLHHAAFRVSTEWQRGQFSELPPAKLDELKDHYQLTELLLIPAGPRDTSLLERRKWAEAISRERTHGIDSRQVALIMNATFGTILNGESDRFYMLQLLPNERGRSLLLVGTENRLLGYLDGFGQVVLVVSSAAGLLILVLYLLLWRYIVAPFKKIRRQAEEAGRAVDDQDDEVEAVVDEYRRVIDELRDKEAELLKANKRIRHKADSLEQYNQYLLGSISSGIVTVGPDGRIGSINSAASEMLGVLDEDFRDTHFWDLFGGNVELVNLISRTLECGQSQPYRETEFRCLSGPKMVLGVSVSSVSDSEGAALGASVLINDLTEVGRLRTELESHRRLAALGEMAGGLAHQLRNSLGAIVGYGRLIQKRLSKQGTSVGSIDSLMQESKEAEALIERFLDLTRPFNYNPTVSSIDDLIDDILDSFRVRPDCSEVKLRISRRDSSKISVDALLLKQALANLIENAINALPDSRGRVEISCTSDDGWLSVHIEDSGAGIPEEDLERIFTPFYSSRPTGTGLGLPLASRIVDLHGGGLTVDSQVGVGTVVSLRFPLVGDSETDQKRVEQVDRVTS